ncbi:hypothetical protein [Boudabousia marimammalium]|uniref:Antitoxin Xre/MbcA/ParS-like toxin-binding domain-containing protein n=1 Tax=Boudabousia marimammalium TaxID=156892 RepID=A0A1Q5PRE2_9ACTO|nr:hypothetical protein [Boudabousia marimammalium]OKL50144.1 hypothetical protein BM477_01735 [Boudabousia marimammalium]
MARRRLTQTERGLLDAIADRMASCRPDEIRPDSITEAARLAVTVLRDKNSLDDVIGPTCTTSVLAKWWQISRQAVHKAVKEFRVVAVQDAKHTWHFPTWQLQEDHRSIDGVHETLIIMRDLPRMDQAMWYIKPAKQLNGLTPAQWLIEKRDISCATTLARQYAHSQIRARQKRD